jgi:hypothetical protein
MFQWLLIDKETGKTVIESTDFDDERARAIFENSLAGLGLTKPQVDDLINGLQGKRNPSP